MNGLVKLKGYITGTKVMTAEYVHVSDQYQY